ncbi:MAG: NADH-quinone oxidoreductase subunit N [Armatimonadetes bacterium]|nr:NADH-quinone oxidoreductase subunit N [Armatimonadota bacterium]
MSNSAAQLAYLAPELVVAVGAVAVLALDILLPERSRRLLARATAAALLASLAAVWWLYAGEVAGRPERLFTGTLVRDGYSLFLDAVFLLAGILGALVSARYVDREGLQSGEYYALMLFAVLGMMLMAVSAELVTLFISYEILSLSVYVLSGIARGRAESAEAAMKYFLLGAFSSGFLIYGIALIYGATGTTALEAIGAAVMSRGLFGNSLLLIGMALVTVGFAFKVAAVPFHGWVPDVYQGAPLPVTAFMSAGVKAAAFGALARVLFTAFGSLSAVWQPALWLLALLTMVLGNTAAIAQTNIKRMLAYSSIAHAGYMLAGVAAYTAGDVALGSVLYYALVYTAMNIGAFAVVLVVGREGEGNQELSDYRGLAVRHPWVAAGMALFMVSLSGLPPTAGFLGKFYILNAALRANLIGLAVALVLASLISWYYYLRVVWLMYFIKPGEAPPTLSGAPSLRLAVGMAAVLVLILGLWPSAALNLAQVAALTVTAGGLPVIGRP